MRYCIDERRAQGLPRRASVQRRSGDQLGVGQLRQPSQCLLNRSHRIAEVGAHGDIGVYQFTGWVCHWFAACRRLVCDGDAGVFWVHPQRELPEGRV